MLTENHLITSFKATGTPPGSTKNEFVNNIGELVYIWPVPVSSVYYSKKYLWVVAKHISGGQVVSISSESNTADGWAIGNGSGVIPLSGGTLGSGLTETVPAGAVKAWCMLAGSGAGGAGGDAQYGGGGGGAYGGRGVGWIPVAAGAKFRVTSAPEADTGNAAGVADGADASSTVLEYSADGTFTDTVNLFMAWPAGGGKYNPAGGGAGGLAETVDVDASVNDSVVYDGRDGLPGVANKGGRSGYRFGTYRVPAAHFNGATGCSGNGATANPGSGSYAVALAPGAATGGSGKRGYAVITYYAA